jgi:hypothetical protein
MITPGDICGRYLSAMHNSIARGTMQFVQLRAWMAPCGLSWCLVPVWPANRARACSREGRAA